MLQTAIFVMLSLEHDFTRKKMSGVRVHRLSAVSLALVLAVAPTLAMAALQPNSLVIGIDGLGYGQRGLDMVSTRNIDSLIDGSWNSGYFGSYSDQAFAGGDLRTTTQQSTVSGPGWSTILTGVWANQHRVRDNRFSNPNYEDNPTYLETLEESISDIATASFVNWDPIDRHIIASADDDNSRLDMRIDLSSDLSVVSDAAQHLRSASAEVPHAVFVALDDVDIAGHSCGSSGQCYESAIRIADALVGRLLRSISSRENLANEEWQIVLTSDHGHRSQGGHGGQSELERRIPFIVSSKRVSQDAMDASDGTPISHADVAPTVLDHFGIEIPGRYWGASRAGRVAVASGDFNLDGVVDQTDVDLLSRHQGELKFDVNQDGAVTDEDRAFLVEQVLSTWFGDSNLDGRFASDDLVEVLIAGEFEDNILGNSRWASGDWNGDAEFDISDLVLAFQDGGYEQGSRHATKAVPEPTSLVLLMAGSIVILQRRRQHQLRVGRTGAFLHRVVN